MDFRNKLVFFNLDLLEMISILYISLTFDNAIFLMLVGNFLKYIFLFLSD